MFIADPRIPGERGGSTQLGFWPFGLMTLFDIPPSLGFDTVLLPFTFVRWMVRGFQENPPPEKRG